MPAIQKLAWKDREADLITKAENSVLDQVLVGVIALIGEDNVIEKLIK